MTAITRDVRWRRVAPLLVATVVILAVGSLLIGAGNMLSPRDVVAALTSDDPIKLHEVAINSRGPRIVLAIMVGAALGAAGALLQTLVRNPLASPGFIGVTAGAVAATVAFSAFGPALAPGTIGWIRPLVATGGGLASATVVYLLSRRLGRVESTRLLLVGIVTGGVLGSVTTVGMISLDEDAGQLLAWLSGSLALRTWSDVRWVAAYMVPGVILTLMSIPRVNLRQLGDGVSVGLGQRQEWDRLIVLVAAVVLTAGSVSVVGAVGFVGLIGPHMARRIVGSNARRLVPASALGGAVMVLGADFVSRNFDPAWIFDRLDIAIRPVNLPVGVYLTLFGVPFLLSLLWKADR